MRKPTAAEPAILATIGITTGDPAGIGPEIVEQALASGQLPTDFQYRVIGVTSREVVPGQATPASARASWEALEEAAALALRGEIAAVATGPVCKHNLYAAGFPYPGQTEFFAARAGVADYAMLLTGGSLTVALVTTHVPLADAARLLASGEIVRVGNLLATFVQTRLGGRTCRIAVAGLNPHAGERGSLGREEIDIIEPAVAELRRGWEEQSVVFAGPVPPDTVFYQAASGQWDAVLCMYHDQGLIPLKLHAFHEGVNVTIGLPIIRTSPDHGTAFEIAGRGLARPDSMIAAIHLAAALARRKLPTT